VPYLQGRISSHGLGIGLLEDINVYWTRHIVIIRGRMKILLDLARTHGFCYGCRSRWIWLEALSRDDLRMFEQYVCI